MKFGRNVDFIQSAISQKSFPFLFHALCFNIIMGRQQRSAVDNLALVQDIFDKFILNCQENYSLGSMTASDEQLVGFRGRCRFRMFVWGGGEYGFKIHALSDARVWYTSSLETYAGKQLQEACCVSNSSYDMVMHVVSTIANSCKDVIMDNWFPNTRTARDLLTIK
jgi:hypothetical protein